MIHFKKGNIFETDAEALVNTVNTVGVMGKGIALQFKKKFPENYKLYKRACEQGKVKIGKMFVTATNQLTNPRWIINFPTKKHWMHRSKYEYIEEGLRDLVNTIRELNISSIAIPPLGSGQGGLDWNKVKNLIKHYLQGLNIVIHVFEPGYWPEVKSESPEVSLTKARALILLLLERYMKIEFEVSLLEVQKLAYFLQRLGQTDLNLNFKKYHYGPYAHNLQHLLAALERKYILTEKPILDSKPLDLIRLNKENLVEIEQFSKTNLSGNEYQRLQTASEIIEGFESPFGLELLASVDWILKDIPDSFEVDADYVIKKIKSWNKSKQLKFTEEQIKIAVEHLYQFREILNYRWKLLETEVS